MAAHRDQNLTPPTGTRIAISQLTLSIVPQVATSQIYWQMTGGRVAAIAATPDLFRELWRRTANKDNPDDDDNNDWVGTGDGWSRISQTQESSDPVSGREILNTMSYLDTPNTTFTVQYQIRWARQGDNAFSAQYQMQTRAEEILA